MLFGLSAAGQGMDPVTGGVVTCNEGDTFNPVTAMCFDSSSDTGEYVGMLTLPTTPMVDGSTIATATTTDYSTLILFGLGIAAVFLFGHGGGQ